MSRRRCFYYSEAGGEVTEVYVKAGDMVTEGQPICHIDTKMVDTAKNSMETAAVNMENANKELERSRVLFESGNMSQQALSRFRAAPRWLSCSMTPLRLPMTTR